MIPRTESLFKALHVTLYYQLAFWLGPWAVSARQQPSKIILECLYFPIAYIYIVLISLSLAYLRFLFLPTTNSFHGSFICERWRPATNYSQSPDRPCCYDHELTFRYGRQHTDTGAVWAWCASHWFRQELQVRRSLIWSWGNMYWLNTVRTYPYIYRSRKLPQ